MANIYGECGKEMVSLLFQIVLPCFYGVSQRINPVITNHSATTFNI